MAKGNPFANKAKFERSKFDKEKPGEKEGGKADMARDKRQAAAAGMPFKKGGKVRGR